MSIKVYQPHEATRLCVIGVPGEGKSVFRAWYTGGIYRITVFNQMGDYHLGELIAGADEYRKRLREFRKGTLRVTVEPSSYDEEAMKDEHDAVCAYVYEIGAMHFGSEEIGLLQDPRDVSPNFNMLCIKGRHRGVSLSWYGQRFHQFPLIARGTASEIVAFRQSDPDDVKDFERRIAPLTAPVPISQLPVNHYLHYNRKEIAFCTPVDYSDFEEYRKAEQEDFTLSELEAA